MDVTARLLRLAARRPHPLVVPAPGGTAARLAVEAELRRRGWPAASSPAEAGLLVVAGEPGPRLRAAIDEVWEEMPGPRARVFVRAAAEVPDALSRGQEVLRDAGGQRAGAAARARGAERSEEQHDAGPDHDHGAHDHGDHGGQGGMDMGGMAMPGGLPMAGRAGDRDGLKLDQLHVPLGPVLTDWPAGLSVRLTVQGDVVQHAEVETYVEGEEEAFPFWDEPWRRAAAGETVSRGDAARRRAAAHLDSLGRLLGVAGWADAATGACRLRDDLLAGAPSHRLDGPLRTLLRRVGGSRPLRWSTDGLGVVEHPQHAAGDVTTRWRRWVGDTEAALDQLDDSRPLAPGDRTEPKGAPGSPAALLDLLPGLLEGAELAGARLIVASLDPDLDALAPVPAGGGRLG